MKPHTSRNTLQAALTNRFGLQAARHPGNAMIDALRERRLTAITREAGASRMDAMRLAMTNPFAAAAESDGPHDMIAALSERRLMHPPIPAIEPVSAHAPEPDTTAVPVADVPVAEGEPVRLEMPAAGVMTSRAREAMAAD